MEIPGYYYDAERKRYFKIENSKTAPSSAAWSSGNVRRRKLGDEEAASAQRHLNLAKSRISRSKLLCDPPTGGFFAREYGAHKHDMQTSCFVDGLRNKGRIPIYHDQTSQVQHMCVASSDNETGLCVLYAVTVDNSVMYSTYLARDKNKRIGQHLLANYHLPPFFPPPPHEDTRIPQVSDIQYDADREALLVTSRKSGYNYSSSLKVIYPYISKLHDRDDPLFPRWELPTDDEWYVPIEGMGRRDEAHCVTPAPKSSSLQCLVGTNKGIVQGYQPSGGPGRLSETSWLTPPNLTHPHAKLQYPLELFRDIFTIGFHPSQTDVFRFGGRPGALFTADKRVPHASWSHIRLSSSITHLRCLEGGNQVLASGLQNQLGVYDLRFVRSHRGAEGDSSGRVDTQHTGDGEKRGTYSHRTSYGPQLDEPQRRNSNWNGREGRGSKYRGKRGNDSRPNSAVAQPVIHFEQYRNAAHIDIGFAYDAETGVVAAAHDTPGTVALYSVRTGSRLRVIDFATEGKRPPKGERNRPQPLLAPEQQDDLPVIQSLQFHTFPGDHTPTLFIGSDKRGGITAFTFGVDGFEDEG
ncbi:hypothetical protein F4808DRAFT_434827 [Astrocystis sublimbata]|nr:hypothetical protein F4808DRAFT_434827 [Astrocystis sublimbata]